MKLTYEENIDAEQFEKLEANRQFFKAQLFGQSFDLAGTPFALPDFVGITAWEAVTCVGFHPTLAQLEAVVELRRSSGYSGDLCEAGSTEYVRFFIDWGEGLGFEDVGLVSFQAFDIHSPEPVQHLVRLDLDDETRRRCCDSAVLPTVRAVLAWNELPSLDPNQLPIYGNSIDADIQIAANGDAFCALKQIDPEFSTKVGFDLELIPNAVSQPVAWSEVIKNYRQQDVDPDRMTYAALGPLVDVDAAAFQPAAWQPDLQLFKELEIDLGSVFENLAFQEKGDTRYEELVCAGLDTDRDTLGAIIHIKRPAGYSGDLCRTGSTEFVRFWADWNGDGNFSDLGTANVPVHDIAKLPAGGLYYAVSLPVDIQDKLEHCENPQLIKIRAVLSWERVPRSATQLERWGNRLDFLVRLRPASSSALALEGEIYRIGGVLTANIDPTSRLAFPSGGILNPSDCHRAATDRPFAGNISVAGRIRDRTGNSDPIYYQVQFARVSGGPRVWAPAAHQATYHLDYPAPRPDSSLTVHSADGWFKYQEELNLGPNSIYVKGEHLANWGSREKVNGVYKLRVAYTKDYPLTPTGTIYYTAPIGIIVDNTNFSVSPLVGKDAVDLTSTLDLVVDGRTNDCRRYKKGAIIEGHLRALDEYFHRWALSLEPSGRTNGTTAIPRCRSYRSMSDNGDADEKWTIDTKHMEACGYTLRLRAYDRAIVDSNGARRHAGEKYIGLVIDDPA